MSLKAKSRFVHALATAILLSPSLVCAFAHAAQTKAVHSAAAPPPVPFRPSVGPHPNQEHLAQWMDHHRNLTPQQQQQALEQEPGFHQLPPQTQQRMRERLAQLNSMSPEQRSHVLARAEEMEHLNPQQRQQVRGAMAQLGAIPQPRRGVVAQVFRDLREMPPSQRQAYMSSDYLQRQLSPSERITLNNLMAVEPLLPPQHPSMPPPGPN